MLYTVLAPLAYLSFEMAGPLRAKDPVEVLSILFIEEQRVVRRMKVPIYGSLPPSSLCDSLPSSSDACRSHCVSHTDVGGLTERRAPCAGDRRPASRRGRAAEEAAAGANRSSED